MTDAGDSMRMSGKGFVGKIVQGTPSPIPSAHAGGGLARTARSCSLLWQLQVPHQPRSRATARLTHAGAHISTRAVRSRRYTLINLSVLPMIPLSAPSEQHAAPCGSVQYLALNLGVEALLAVIACCFACQQPASAASSASTNLPMRVGGRRSVGMGMHGRGGPGIRGDEGDHRVSCGCSHSGTSTMGVIPVAGGPRVAVARAACTYSGSACACASMLRSWLDRRHRVGVVDGVDPGEARGEDVDES